MMITAKCLGRRADGVSLKPRRELRAVFLRRRPCSWVYSVPCQHFSRPPDGSATRIIHLGDLVVVEVLASRRNRFR